MIIKEYIENVLPNIPIPLTGNLKNNYEQIRKLFERKYEFPDFESIQTEICTCLTFGLNQASIMLTIHLLERFLLNYLIYHDGLQNIVGKKDLGIDEYFEKEVEDFCKLILKDKIDIAFEMQLITKEQKEQLHYMRVAIRNPYSHSNVKNIFKDSTISGQIVTTSEEGFSVGINKDIKIWKNPMIQGILQAEFAESIAFPFFACVDSIIRESEGKIIANIT
jgi:hypothetical protein